MSSPPIGNARLYAARESKGLTSRPAFRRALNTAASIAGYQLDITERTIRRWESADPPWPQQPHIDALESVLERPATQLGFIPKPGYRVTAGQVKVRPRIHETFQDTAINDFDTATTAFRKLYWTVPPRALHASVSAHSDLGDALLAAATPEQNPLVASAAAKVHLLAGRLALFDIHDNADAYLHFTLALEQAQRCDDTAIAATVLAHLAIAAMNAENDESAWNWIQLAKSTTEKAPASKRLHAWVSAVAAEVETYSGNTNRAIQLLVEAEQAIAASDAEPDWLDWLTPTRMATLKATILLASGRSRDARTALERALDDLAVSDTKQRASVCADLAAVAAAEGETLRARDLLLRALDEVGNHGYQSVLRRIAQVRAQLGNAGELMIVDQRLASWNTILGLVG